MKRSVPARGRRRAPAVRAPSPQVSSSRPPTRARSTTRGGARKSGAASSSRPVLSAGALLANLPIPGATEASALLFWRLEAKKSKAARVAAEELDEFCQGMYLEALGNAYAPIEDRPWKRRKTGSVVSGKGKGKGRSDEFMEEDQPIDVDAEGDLEYAPDDDDDDEDEEEPVEVGKPSGGGGAPSA